MNDLRVRYFERASGYYYLQVPFYIGIREKILLEACVQDVKHI